MDNKRVEQPVPGNQPGDRQGGEPIPDRRENFYSDQESGGQEHRVPKRQLTRP